MVLRRLIPVICRADNIAAWNRDARFGRAYLDRDGDPVVEMDVDVSRGATTEALASNLESWRLVLREFSKALTR